MDILKRSNEQHLVTADSLKTVKSKLASTQETLRTRDERLTELQSALTSVKRQLDKKEADSKLPDPKDDTIASFERQVESIRRELAVITAAKVEAVQAALDEATGARKERDLAARAVEEAERRIRDVEEMAELQAKRHELVEEQTAKEKTAATAALEADIERLKDDLASKVSRVAQLERTIESLENLEARRKKYEADQRSGLDKLKSRMEDMRAKSSQPPPGQRPAPTPTSLSSSTGSQPESSEKPQQQVKELQVRNGELLARVSELQRAVDAGIGQTEKRAMEGTIKEQKARIVETETVAEDWKQVSTPFDRTSRNGLISYSWTEIPRYSTATRQAYEQIAS